jgi:hypothetical protein
LARANAAPQKCFKYSFSRFKPQFSWFILIAHGIFPTKLGCIDILARKYKGFVILCKAAHSVAQPKELWLFQVERQPQIFRLALLARNDKLIGVNDFGDWPLVNAPRMYRH